MAYLITILIYLSIILAFSSIILVYLPIMVTGVIAVFTVLYWWNARRAFLLELDRVVLWFRLEENKKEKDIQSKIEEVRIRLTEDFNDISDNDKKEAIRTMRKKFEIRKFTREMAKDLAFFGTLKSKKLRDRLRDYEKKQIELSIDFHKKTQNEEEKQKGLTNGKIKTREENSV